MKNVMFFSLAMIVLVFSSCKEDLSQMAQVEYFLTIDNAESIEGIELPFLHARVKQVLANQKTSIHNTNLEEQTCELQIQKNTTAMKLGKAMIEPCNILSFDLSIDCWANLKENGNTRRIAVMGIEEVVLPEDHSVEALAQLEITFELDWVASRLEFVAGEETLFPVFTATIINKN